MGGCLLLMVAREVLSVLDGKNAQDIVSGKNYESFFNAKKHPLSNPYLLMNLFQEIEKELGLVKLKHSIHDPSYANFSGAQCPS